VVNLTLFLVLLLFIASIAPLVWDVAARKRKPDVFKPVYPLTGFYFLLFGMRPLFLAYSGSPISESASFNLAIVYSIVGLGFFYVGYFASLGRKFAIKWCKERGEQEVSNKRFWVIVLAYCLVSALGALAMRRIAGVTSGEPLIQQVFEHGMSRNYYFIWAASVVQVAYFYAWGRHVRGHITIAIPSLLFVVSLAVRYLSGAGTRWGYLLLAAVPLIMWQYLSGKRFGLKKVIFLLIPVALTLMMALNYFRHYGSFSGLRLSPAGTILADLVPFDVFVKLIDNTPDKLNFQLGRGYWVLPIAPIPRRLWPGKPVVSMERMVTDALFGPGTKETYTMTMVGDFYLNFHIPGIVLGMFTWGVFWRAMYDALLRRRRDVAMTMFYAIALTVGFSHVRGYLGSYIISMLEWAIPLVLFDRFVTRRSRNDFYRAVAQKDAL
jgi:hypothetical protein